MVKKNTLLHILKIVVSLLLLGYIASKIDWEQAFANLKKANYFLIIVVFFLILLERVELTYKWNLLLRARGVVISFGRLFWIYAISAFWGLFLPSSIGSDVVKGYYLIKDNSEKAASISSVLVDRILGVLTLLMLCVISLFIAGDLISNNSIKLYLFTISIFFLIGLFFFQKKETANLLHKLLSKFKFKSITEKIIKLHLSVLEYKGHPKTLIVTFIITFFVNITRVMIFYVISLAYNIPIPIIYFFIFIPILTVIVMIPISIGGLGVGEGAFITFFAMVGISINDSVVVALTNTLTNTIFTLVGGLALLFFKSADTKEVLPEAEITSDRIQLK